ncbi:Cu(I)-responsive transcriptional regulator [Rhodospirillaceae bacterium KN72]|uniref:Cu(I)-responsive transcriptional regulator n=1 Tax=Pacificispira spongiicola TaxID=2729598 RepID=A0A7Y0DWJ1_9PROT|nr:Cu(I)-responsive transcriptional regulator [Pacificispira spongiicola]NMM42897.1 Cu(I)-responsive transcriptional regulator [Pacificispira spongiicola]
MNISEASKRTGLPAKTIRYYEDINLVVPDRHDNGYRDFSTDDVGMLHFLKRSRDLGFSIDDCRLLLSLYTDEHRTSAEVKSIAAKHLDEIRAKIAELESMHRTLSHLVHCCDGDSRPSCPILDSLAGDKIA